jgi:hypothetical protein
MENFLSLSEVDSEEFLENSSSTEENVHDLCNLSEDVEISDDEIDPPKLNLGGIFPEEMSKLSDTEWFEQFLENAELFFDSISSGEANWVDEDSDLLLWSECMLILHNFIDKAMIILTGCRCKFDANPFESIKQNKGKDLMPEYLDFKCDEIGECSNSKEVELDETSIEEVVPAPIETSFLGVELNGTLREEMAPEPIEKLFLDGADEYTSIPDDVYRKSIIEIEKLNAKDISVPNWKNEKILANDDIDLFETLLSQDVEAGDAVEVSSDINTVKVELEEGNPEKESEEGEERKGEESNEENDEGSNIGSNSEDSSTEPFDPLTTASCMCYKFEDINECLNYLGDPFCSSFNPENIFCHLDNYVRCFNLVSNTVKVIRSPERLALCDLFYRFRHEILFKLLCLTLNLPTNKSDTPFSNFGLHSNRTPDLIIEENGKIFVIEVGASSSFEKAAANKGLERMGFEGKYKKEVDMLAEKGFDVSYHPFIFDMSNFENKDYLNEIEILGSNFHINKPSLNNLTMTVKELCLLTLKTKSYLTPVAHMLFQDDLKITPNHDELKFMYNQNIDNSQDTLNYSTACISLPIYNRVNNLMSRIPNIIDKNVRTGNEKFILIMNTNTGRLMVDKNNKGATLEEFEKNISEGNKLFVFRNLMLKTGSRLISCLDSDSGVKFVERSESSRIVSVEEVKLSYKHTESPYHKLGFGYSRNIYLQKIEKFETINYNNNFYDRGYEDKIINGMGEFDSGVNKLDHLEDYKPNLGVGLLSENRMEELDINNRLDELATLQISKNKETPGPPAIIIKSKSPFLLPLARFTSESYTSLQDKCENFVSKVSSMLGNSNPYTKEIIDRFLDPNFSLFKDKKQPSVEYNRAVSRRNEVSSKLSRLQATVYRKYGQIRLKDVEDPVIIEEYKLYRDEIRCAAKEVDRLRKQEGISNETQLIRLPTKSRTNRKNKKFRTGGETAQVKKSFFSPMFDIEMRHFRDRNVQSTVEGVGYRVGLEPDFETDRSIFLNIMEEMMVDCGDNPDLFNSDLVSEDCSLLSDFKKKAQEDYHDLINHATRSALGHSSAFISRLAHSLMFYSQAPFSSDYVRVDNLGYKNVLLIVKGGKKIFKTKSSKLFRILYPMYESTYDWYVSTKGLPSSTDIFFINGRRYALTPWSLMHESILNDAISFYPRVMSFTVLNSNPELALKKQFDKIYFNVLLAFHNRRNTEVILSNLRYILLATLGDFSGISQIFDEFVGFNYDCFQSYIRGCILFNYRHYFKSLNNLKQSKNKTIASFQEAKKQGLCNIFTMSALNNEDELALMIYSSFLMTKGPYTRPVERANNLKGIMKIHELYLSTVGDVNSLEEQFSKTTTSLTADYRTYIQDLFKNDFSFDPYYCANVGNFMDSYFSEKGVSDDFQSKWIEILNLSWDEMATSTGLRGDYREVEDFWGQKGYFVVYKKIVNDESYMSFVHNLINSTSTNDEKRKLLRTINTVFQEKVESYEDQEFLIFHAVDKVQWRGGREIYVMDIATKTYQQPIEKFMAHLCKNMDNELISIPSDRRAQVIHHSIFERDLPMKETLTWYLTLDCTKWAPKSNFLKFVSVILSMKCLPPTFKTHFMNYIVKLFNKRVYFNIPEVEVLKNNPLYKDKINKMLIFDETLKAYYLKMNYSWMMGIFNYTSSFLHAANQLYFSYIIFKTSLKFYQEECSMIMFAHSDDSGGRISADSKPMVVRALTHYEVHLKACNHLLSKKKSVVSRYYFEILSIIYLFKKLLALLPKFLGGLRFLPTDKGPVQDMLQSYSKCIEVLVAGGSFSVAYLVMKFYSFLVYRFYHGRSKILNPDIFNLPLQCFGLPDAHPLMVLICGSDSDILRLIYAGDEEKLTDLMSFANRILNDNPTDTPFRSPKFVIQVRGLKKGFEEASNEYSDFLKKWSIGNVNFHSTPFNLMGFLKKLNDPGFVGSLVNESQTRRISRAYFLRSGDSILVNGIKIKLTGAKDLMNLFYDYLKGVPGSMELLEGSLNKEGLAVALDEIAKCKLESSRQMNVYKQILKTPLKVMKYFSTISLKDKKIVPSIRTLKPTHLLISKTTQVFSSVFDPSQIVSFIKEPELSWALPNSKGLITAKNEVEHLIDKLGFKSTEIFPELLLRLIRLYTTKSEKEIYLYSKVPTELRQIKTQTALLTFLAVNSFYNKEVEGLVVNLSSLEGLTSLATLNINEETYILSNILSILFTMLKSVGVERLTPLNLLPINEIGWLGGSIYKFLEFIELEFTESEDFKPLMLPFQFIKAAINSNGLITTVNCKSIINSFFHMYIKTQKSKEGWYGKGEILFYLGGKSFTMSVYNTSIISFKTNFTGKLTVNEAAYLFDSLIDMNLLIRPGDMTSCSRLKTKLCFGYDYSGDLCVGEVKYMRSGYPADLLLSVAPFLTNLEMYTMTQIGKDSYNFYTDSTMDSSIKKVYCLRSRADYVLTLFNRIFSPNELNEIILEQGSNDFNDFLCTEIMPQYGSEVYINYQNFLDGFPGSRIYKIFKKSIEKGWSNLPKTIKHSNLPAPEGSLTRILLDYSMNSDDTVVNFAKNLNPEIMSLRSEFPESMSIILSDKMVESFNKIYNPSERSSIYEDYSKLSNCENVDEMRAGMINLMKYWGYGSLVNTIEVYNLAPNEKNYSYFSTKLMDSHSSSIHLEVFRNLHKCIAETLMEFQHIYVGLDHPVKVLFDKRGVKSIIMDMERTLCMSVEGYMVHFGCQDYYQIVFFNTFIAYLQDEDFCSVLDLKFKKDNILSSLPVNYKNRLNICVLYNTLSKLWYRKKKVDCDRDYTMKVQINVENKNSFLSMHKDLTKGGNSLFSPASNYYGNFINTNIKNLIMDANRIKIGNTVYNIEPRFCKPSSDKVPVIKELNLKNVVNEEVFDEEYWEEIYIECQSEELDLETIIDLIPEEGLIFEEDVTTMTKQKGKNVIDAEICWVIDPYKVGAMNRHWKFRQCGENVVVLTNNIYMEMFDGMPNYHCRIIDFGTRCGVNSPMMVAHVFCHPLLELEFWDKYLGGRVFTLTQDVIDNTFINLIRDDDGEINSFNKRDDLKSISALMEQAQEVEEVKSSSDLPVKQSESPRFKAFEYLDLALSNNKISRSTYHKLKSKYRQQDSMGVLSNEEIFKNVMLEVQMAVMKNQFGAGMIEDLTSADSLKIFQAPEYWGLGHGVSTRHNKLYTDKKLKAELESLVGDLTEGLANGSVKISENMINLCKSNLKIWSKIVKSSNFKQENKKFLLTLFTTIVNSAVKAVDAPDELWQNFINKVTQYMADDGDDEDDDNWQSSFTFNEDVVNLKFKLKGT